MAFVSPLRVFFICFFSGLTGKGIKLLASSISIRMDYGIPIGVSLAALAVTYQALEARLNPR